MKASKLLTLALIGCGLSAASLSAQTARGSATSSAVRVGPAPSIIATPARPMPPAVRPLPPGRPGIVVTPGRPTPIDVRPVDRPGNPRVEAARLKAERIKNAREDAADGNRRRREHRPATGR